MNLLFLMKTYHDADKFFEKKENIIVGKDYKQINEIFCKFYCNWLSEFYLDLKNKKNCEIIFPGNLELIKNISCNKTKENYFNYLNFILNDFKPDLIITNTEEKDIISKIHIRDCYKILWKSSKLSEKNTSLELNKFNHIISDNRKILNIAEKKGINKNFFLVSVPDRLICNKKFYQRSNEILFTGSLGYDYSNRRKVIKSIIKNNLKIEIRSRDVKDFNKYLDKILKIIPGNLIFKDKLSKITKSPFYGTELFEHMQNFKFIINSHSKFDENNAINLRVFESLSLGCLLFTDENTLLQNYFKDNEHLIIYKNPKDLINKIKFYKENSELSIKIAENGFQTIKNKHTTSVRLEEFKKIFKF